MAKTRTEAGSVITSRTARYFQTEAYASADPIATHFNPLRGIQIIGEINPKPLSTVRTFALAQDGVLSGFMRIAYTPHNTPTSITIATRIQRPESDQIGDHYAVMVTRDPKTGRTEVKSSIQPLANVSQELLPYNYTDALRQFMQVREHGTPVTDIADILLQTASIERAMQSDSTGNFPSSPLYLQQLLREVREQSITTALPTKNQTPIPNSGNIEITPLTADRSQVEVSFRMHNEEGSAVGEHYTVMTSDTSDYLLVSNRTQGVTYFTDGNGVTVYTPFGAAEIGGFESIALLHGMHETVAAAIRAAEVTIIANNRSNGHVWKEAMAKHRDLIRYQFPLGLRQRVARVLRQPNGMPQSDEQQTIRGQSLKRVLRKSEKVLRKTEAALESAEALNTATSSYLDATTHNLKFFQDIERVLLNTQSLVDQLHPHGKHRAEEGIREETTVIRDQFLFAMEPSHVRTDIPYTGVELTQIPLVTALGNATAELVNGKVVVTLPMYGQSLKLSLDPNSGEASLIKLPEGTNVPLPIDYLLYATARLVVGLQARHPRRKALAAGPEETITSRETPETTAKLFFESTIERVLESIHAAPLALQLTMNQGIYAIIGRPGEDIDAHYDQFILSTVRVNGSIKIKLAIEKNGEIIELYLDPQNQDRKTLSLTHPYEPEIHRTYVTMDNQSSCAKKIDLFAEMLVARITKFDHLPDLGIRSSSQRRKRLAGEFHLPYITGDDIEGLEQIETLLRQLANLRPKSQSHDNPGADAWLTIPGTQHEVIKSMQGSNSSLLGMLLRLLPPRRSQVRETHDLADIFVH